MAKLKDYNEKRNFTKTAEPKGTIKKSSGNLRFVVQKHQASRLHFDFRIEVDGVLVSWALPKGPPIKSAERHLAMMVEDHPFDYRNFEGTIPEGNYGAGTVMLWDEGTYATFDVENDEADIIERDEIEKHIKKQIKKGTVKLILYGEKLHGRFAFVRFKRAGDNAWLMIKDKDEYEGKKIVNEDLSVRTGRTLEQIEKGEKGKKGKFPASREVTRRSSKSKVESEGGKPPIALRALPSREVKKAQSSKLSPMLATLVEKSFNDPGWIFEIKWDGYRAIAHIDDNVQLYSRKQQDLNEMFAPIAEELHKIKKQMILDGEVVVLDEKGRSDFQALQNYRSDPVGADHDQHLQYYVFDILEYEGRDLRQLPLIERKEFLKKVLPKLSNVKFSDHVEEKGKAFFAAAKKKKLEGIIAKKKDSEYENGVRTKSWQKIKILNGQEVVIGGYTFPEGKRNEFGSLLIGVYKRGKLRYVGHTGSGFDEKSLKAIKKELDKHKAKESPFVDAPYMNNVAQWLKPAVVAEVKFSGWTDQGYMRQAIFLGLRDDKNAKEVIGEKPEAFNDGVKVSEEQFEITHPEKIYWPKEKYTKGDMIKYYEDMAEIMLPYLKDRPQNMNRFPHGITGPSFYQKDVDSVPSFVEIATIHSDSNNKDLDYVVCNNKDTLLYIANLGSIEINPWNSRLGQLDNPDYLIFDLDAASKYFENIITVALEIHKFCEDLEIEHYIKTSGKRGLHIHIPLGAKYSFDQVRTFGELISRKMEQKLPKIINLVRDPEARKKFVYIDYLQNRRGQTTASVYSLRPVDGAPASTPLKWSEVNKKLDPKKFNIKTMRKRIDKVGDMWKGVLGKGINIEKVLRKL